MNILSIISITICLLFIATAPAYAYLDPGTGSMLLQIILGGLAGLAVAIKMFWSSIAAFFKFGKGKAPKSESKPEED